MIDFDKTILYQFIHFLILLFILNFLLFKPVLKALNKRRDTLKGLADDVERAKEETVDLEKNYASTSVEKRKPIVGSKDAIVSQANKEAVHVIEKARSELAEELAKIKSEIEVEGRKALDALKADVGKLSTEAAQKILQRSI